MKLGKLALIGLLVLIVACASTGKKGMEKWEIPPAAGGPMPVDDGILFQFEDATARTVHLAGEFNNWSTTAEPMTKNEQGIWQVVIALAPGTYQYKFVIDGGDVWKHDPHNPKTTDDGYGGLNSVLVVE